MNYRETLSWLFNQLPMYQRIGAAAYKADLNNTIALCNLLGNPQDSFRSIHVAGTNGKGSVSHFLASVLQEHGLKTGLYTSPHLKDFRERVRVNGRMIPKQKVTAFVEKYRPEVESIRPSFFEWTACLAFRHFQEEEVDIAVIEVGMGGRLDSTNIITPLVSVITNISYDHMQFLGDTLEKIAGEKAGIMKKGIPVVIGETQPELESFFRDHARQTGSPILFADQWPGTERIRQDTGMGHYQQKNIRTTLAVIHILSQIGYPISEEGVQRGIDKVVLNTGFQGRWQTLNREPLVICDTCHNESGIREAMCQIELTPHQHLHLVFGMVSDKSMDPILRLLPATASFYFCKPNIPRGLDPHELQQQALRFGMRGKVYSSVRKALASAKNSARPEDLIFVGGSTFVVAEVLP